MILFLVNMGYTNTHYDQLVCFFDDRERQAYHGWLREAVQRERSHLHAYVSMTIHVHLLLTAQPVSVSDCEWGAFACQACHSCSDPRSLRRKLNC